MNLPGPFYMPKKGQHKIKDEFTKKKDQSKKTDQKGPIEEKTKSSL